MTREEMFNANLALVGHIIKRWGNLMQVMPYEDILQEGKLELWHSVCGYDPTRGAAFSTYAGRRIENRFKALWREALKAAEVVPLEEDIQEPVCEPEETVRYLLDDKIWEKYPRLLAVVRKQLTGLSFKKSVIALYGESSYRRLLDERKIVFAHLREEYIS